MYVILSILSSLYSVIPNKWHLKQYFTESECLSHLNDNEQAPPSLKQPGTIFIHKGRYIYSVQAVPARY